VRSSNGLNIAISESTRSRSISSQPVDSQTPGMQTTTEAQDLQARSAQESGETRRTERGEAKLPRGGGGRSGDKPHDTWVEESATLFHTPSKEEKERNAHKIPGYQQEIRTASESLRAEMRSKQPPRQEKSAPEGRKLDLSEVGTQQTEPEPLQRGELPAKEASRVIGQFDLGYILVEEPGALWVVDQHVAHERVLLDRLNAGESVYVQQLLAPEVVELSDTEAAEGRELIEELSVYGFEAEPFGPRSFRITGVISTLADRDVAEAFKDVLSVALGTEGGQHREQGILATVACKSAVKFGDRLSHGEMEAHVEQWLTTDLPATCPHGRSICYRMDAREIGRKLDRH
jgi:DNA mismatch repair protein MutL